MHLIDEHVLSSVISLLLSITISVVGTLYVLKKIPAIKWRLLAYALIIFFGVCCLMFWPLNKNGSIKYIESLIGLGLIIPVLIVLLVRNVMNMTKSLIDKKIKDYEYIAQELNIVVNNVEESRKTQQNSMYFSGKLSNLAPFTIAQTTDFFQESRRINKTETLKRDYHFMVFRFFLQTQLKIKFRIVTIGNHYAQPENAFGENDRFLSFNTSLEEKFAIIYPKDSKLKFFFDKPHIQQLLIQNYTTIRGYIELNVEDGLFLIKSASPSENNVSIFNSNWRKEVNQITIQDIQSKLEFVESFLKEIEAYA